MKPSNTILNTSQSNSVDDYDDEPDEWDKRIIDTGCHQENLNLQLCHADTGDWRKCLKEMQAFRLSFLYSRLFNYMPPLKQSSSIQHANGDPKPKPPVPFKLTLYPPSLRPAQNQNQNQNQTSSKEEDVSIEISSDEELDGDERYPEEATRDIKQLIEESTDKQLFHARLKRLEKDSLNRLENKWTGIISKYSSINDDMESDEIDLVTGDIVTNNGHLNRLKSGGSGGAKSAKKLTVFKLWKQEGDTKQDEAIRNRLRKLEQRSSKQQDKNRRRRMQISSPSKSSSSQFASITGDSFRNISPTKGQVPTAVETDESPTKKRKIFDQQVSETSASEYSETESDISSDYSIDDGSEADNTVEEDESYEENANEESRDENEVEGADYVNDEKEYQMGQSNAKYFKQQELTLLNAPRLGPNSGPLARYTPEPESSSGSDIPRSISKTKRGSGIEFGLISTRHQQQRSPVKSMKHRQVTDKDDIRDESDDSVHNVSHLFLDHSSPKSNKNCSRQSANESRFEPSPFLGKSSPASSPQDATNIKQMDVYGTHTLTSSFSSSPSKPPKPVTLPSSTSCESFEEQISIVEEPYYFMGNRAHTASSSAFKVFNCYVNNCSYCTMNKKVYSSHLIKHHSKLLYKLGYPVEPKSESKHGLLNNESIDNQITDLNKQRLLREFPLRFDLPASKHVHKCDQKINGADNCQMFFLHAKDLMKHKQSGTCSLQTQIIFCPILGCGYMTDGGYDEWRAHLIDAGHCAMTRGEAKIGNGDEPVGVSSPMVGDDNDSDDGDDDIEIMEIRSVSGFEDKSNDKDRNPNHEMRQQIPPQNPKPNDDSPTKRTFLLSNLKVLATRSQDDRCPTKLPAKTQVDSDYDSIDEVFD
ncbi:hypothetical protein CANMA_003164 [Candida margitis]|uniref:uncharacterized protein n=1 Tax=Candida margitis TaxID=1775924 RepID=UPI002226B17C|nr:uncharacterized protein CANMA_003164 [Candida margitis]KAI5967344.1 hypothetical protein CANMA_003164 [Candida margitis]